MTADRDALLQDAIREDMRRRGLGALLDWSPQLPTEKQLAFLETPDFEALYGGAAGGGKSSAALMDHARFVDRPSYSGLLLRRTYADLSLPGALMDRAHEWWTGTGATWNDRDKRWRFPSGATIQFGYCETSKDVYRYQGSEFHRIGVDELTQWAIEPYQFLMSRIRRGVADGIPLGIRGYTNPGGIGHKWVKERFVDRATAVGPFIPALLPDNPHVDQESYRAALERLADTTRDQLLLGLWVQDEAGRVYRYARAANAIPELPERTGWRGIICADLGASEREPTSGFVVALWHPRDKTVYIPESWKEAGIIPATLAERIHETQARWRDRGVDIEEVILDEGALGKGYGNEMRQRYKLAARPADKPNKLGYRKLLNGCFRDGLVQLVEPHCAPLIDELEHLVWNETGTDCARGLADHCTDALLYAWRRAYAWASEAPAQQPPPGSPGWVNAEAKRIRDAEKRAYKERRNRAAGEGW